MNKANLCTTQYQTFVCATPALRTHSRPVYLVDSPAFGDGEHLHRNLGCNVLDREGFYRGTVKISG